MPATGITTERPYHRALVSHPPIHRDAPASARMRAPDAGDANADSGLPKGDFGRFGRIAPPRSPFLSPSRFTLRPSHPARSCRTDCLALPRLVTY